MTKEKIMGLSDRELDAQIANKLFGLIPCYKWECINLGSAGGPALQSTCKHKCYSTKEIKVLNETIGGPPKYSSDLNLCYQAEEKIKEMGLHGKRSQMLEALIKNAPDILLIKPQFDNWEEVADVDHAHPILRARAILMTIEEKGG